MQQVEELVGENSTIKGLLVGAGQGRMYLLLLLLPLPCHSQPAHCCR